MSALFPQRTNAWLRGAIILALVGGSASVLVAWAIYHSPYRTLAGVSIEQPVPFSHKHHVGGVGLDCRYCHTSVETSASAGMPATETCMGCHTQIWATAAMLAPLRESVSHGEPLAWTRVYKLPDYVFFNHAMHVRRGVECSTCHGHLEEAPLVARAQALNMRWCIDCHEDVGPERMKDCSLCHR